jgi:hypothetical protein
VGQDEGEKEMKLVRFMVVALAAMSFATVAQGATNVWFTGTAIGPGAGVSGGGALGSVLELSSNPGLGDVSWNIVAHMATDEGIFAYDISVDSSDAGLVGSGNALVGGSDFGAGIDFNTNGASPGTVARIAQTDNGGPNNGADLPLFSFTLTYNGAGDASLIAGTAPDSFGWGDINFGFGNIFYGADTTSVEGFDAYGGTVISITEVPEPATLSLLGIGAIALIRRRR